MKNALGLAKTLIPVSLLLSTNAAQAAPLNYDCDAATNATSTVENLAQTTPAISGILTPKRTRQGRLLPMAGALISSPDGQSSASIVLTLPSPNAEEMNITMIIGRPDSRNSRKLGTVTIDTPIPFRFFIDGEGVARVFIRDQSWSSEFMRLIGGKEGVFCSTGQFTFSDLRFSD